MKYYIYLANNDTNAKQCSTYILNYEYMCMVTYYISCTLYTVHNITYIHISASIGVFVPFNISFSLSFRSEYNKLISGIILFPFRVFFWAQLSYHRINIKHIENDAMMVLDIFRSLLRRKFKKKEKNNWKKY